MQTDPFKKYIRTSIKDPIKNAEINYIKNLYKDDVILKYSKKNKAFNFYVFFKEFKYVFFIKLKNNKFLNAIYNNLNDNYKKKVKKVIAKFI